MMNHVCGGPLKEIGTYFPSTLNTTPEGGGGGDRGNCSRSGAGLAPAQSSGNGLSLREPRGRELGRPTLSPSQEEVLPNPRGAAGPPRGASSVEERWGSRAQVTGPEKDGAARGGGGVGRRRLRRGTRWGPKQQAERGEPGRQRRGNEKQT